MDFIIGLFAMVIIVCGVLIGVIFILTLLSTLPLIGYFAKIILRLMGLKK
jgi:hypothetical protein